MHFAANLVGQSCSLIVIWNHLNVGDAVVKSNTITCLILAPVDVDEVDMQMIESWRVVEVAHDLSSIDLEFTFDGFETLISHSFKQRKMLSREVTDRK